MNIQTVAAGVVRTENIFDTGTNLMADVKSLGLAALAVVAVVFVVLKFVQSRGSVGSIVGVIAVGAIALWGASNMDKLKGDVDDTVNSVGVHQIVSGVGTGHALSESSRI